MEDGPPVWGRKEVVLWECPKSFVTAESDMLVRQFLLRRSSGQADFTGLSAREVDAFSVLEREYRRERENGRQNARRHPEGI